MQPASPPRLILASASPRRRELLATIGLPFEVVASPLGEPANKPERMTPRRWAEAVAFFKAHAVAVDRPADWVLAADTIVSCDGQVLGKPADAADARRMLQLQAGRSSDVITGVCLLEPDALSHGRRRQRRIRSVVTRVWMRDAPAEIEAYVQSGEWAGKAGAYGIQDVGDRLIERIEGSFSNVVGLPLELVSELLTAAALISPPRCTDL